MSIEALISNEVYNDNPQQNINGYQLLEFDNDNGIAVYHNKDDNRTIYGIRGTKSFNDIKTDLLSMGGKLRDTDRFKNNLNFVNRTLDKYNLSAGNAELTGHSLGGNLAIELGYDYGLKSHVFNPYVNGKQWMGDDKYKNVVAHITKLDPIGLTGSRLKGRGEINYYDPRHILNPHTIKNFL
jgi:hypothetical protein